MDAISAVTGLAVRLDVVPSAPEAGRPVRWELIVANRSGHALTLSFGSTQRGDVVLEAGGGEWYRWSEHRLFPAAPTEQPLADGELWHCTLEDVLRVPPGRYHLSAEVTAHPQPASIVGKLYVHQADAPATLGDRPTRHWPGSTMPGGGAAARAAGRRVGGRRPESAGVLTSEPSAALYGWCRGCQRPRVLRTLGDQRDILHRYEVACLRCGTAEPLIRHHGS